MANSTILFKVNSSLHYVDDSKEAKERRKRLVKHWRNMDCSPAFHFTRECWHSLKDCKECFNQTCLKSEGK